MCIYSILYYALNIQFFQGIDHFLTDKLFYSQINDYGAIIHDSYTCNQFPSNFNRPFPTQRVNVDELANIPNYVGTNGDSITLEEHGECPEQCRPEEHLDWILC